MHGKGVKAVELKSAGLVVRVDRVTGLAQIAGRDGQVFAGEVGLAWRTSPGTEIPWVAGAKAFRSTKVSQGGVSITVHQRGDTFDGWIQYKQVSAGFEVSAKLAPGKEVAEGYWLCLGMPRIRLSDRMIDPHRDPDGLFDDGVDLGGGLETVPWRVFQDTARRTGFAVVTARIADQQRLFLWRRNALFGPKWVCAYRAANQKHAYWRTGPHTNLASPETLHFWLLSYDVSSWPAKPDFRTLVGTPLEIPKGAPPGFPVEAPADAITETYTPNSWQWVAWEEGRVLFARPGERTPVVSVPLEGKGPHRVIVRMASPVRARLRGERHWRVLRSRRDEASLGVFDLDGNSRLEVCPTGWLECPATFLGARTEPLAEAVPPERRHWILGGLVDINDIGLAGDETTPEPFLENIRAHAETGFDHLYWRIMGNCLEFRSDHAEIRTIDPRIQGFYRPSEAYLGRLYERCDVLEAVCAEAHRHGMDIYGWWRMANYANTPQSKFFLEHPKYRDIGFDGQKYSKLCFALPEVREWFVNVLSDAMKYDMDGIVLGTLRHPPLVHYHPVLVQGFRKRFGVEPPAPYEKEGKGRRLLTTDLHMKWYQYRADFVTEFVRELRHAAAKAGKPDFELVLWVRPDCPLFDGVDTKTLIDEKLIDLVLHDTNVYPSAHRVSREFLHLIGGKVSVLASMPAHRGPIADLPGALEEVGRQIAAGSIQGLNIYESNYAVQDADWRGMFLRVGRRHNPPGIDARP